MDSLACFFSPPFFKQPLSPSGYYWDHSLYCWTTENRWITADGVLLLCPVFITHVTLLSLFSISPPFLGIVFSRIWYCYLYRDLNNECMKPLLSKAKTNKPCFQLCDSECFWQTCVLLNVLEVGNFLLPVQEHLSFSFHIDFSISKSPNLEIIGL